MAKGKRVTTKVESRIVADIMVAAGKISECRLFRNHRGVGWTGKLAQNKGKYTILVNARRCSFGLFPGASDMIGIFAGRFLAVEAKRPGEHLTESQSIFGAMVRALGGIFIVAHSADEFISKLLKSELYDYGNTGQ